MSSSYAPKLKATWTPAFHEIFVDSCLEEALNGNKPTTHFTKEGWRNIVDSFNKKTGVRYVKKQIKNHWDNTKEQWKVWCKLIGDSSMKWDPETNKFGASDEDWANHIQANAEAAQFRFKQLQHTEKLEIIFDGVINTADLNSPVQRKRQSNGCASSLVRTKETGVVKPDVKNGRYRDAFTVQSTHGRTFTGEQSMSSSSFLKPKAIWTPALHKIFVDLCLDQTLKGNRPETHFTKEGWRIIVESFKKKAGLSYDRQQLKNHWDITKEQWKVWCKLIGTSSMKWDPNTNKFGASQEDWVNYIQANPEANQFRFKQLHDTDKLEIIFDGTISTGETEPPIQRRKLNDSSATSLMHINEPSTTKLDGRTERLCDAIESRSAVTVQKSHSTQGKLGYSIGECIECLDGMEEVEQGSDLYLFALDIFLKKEYREIFLQLKKPSVRIAWLQRLQSVGPPLH